MSRKVYAKSIPPKDLIVADEIKSDVQRSEVSKPVQKFKSLAEQIAKSSIFHKNYYVPELREKFRHVDRMKRIDKVFPYAKIREGVEVMLFVDEPKTPIDVEICEKKVTHMKDLGYAYVYLESDTTLYDALTQLGEI